MAALINLPFVLRATLILIFSKNKTLETICFLFNKCVGGSDFNLDLGAMVLQIRINIDPDECFVLICDNLDQTHHEGVELKFLKV